METGDSQSQALHQQVEQLRGKKASGQGASLPAKLGYLKIKQQFLWELYLIQALHQQLQDFGVNPLPAVEWRTWSSWGTARVIGM